MKKNIILTSGILGVISIIIGAFGSHALNDYLISIERIDTFEVAVKYQFYHVFFLLSLGLLSEIFHPTFIKYAFYSCLLGILLFSGSLYILCFTNNSFYGMITPFGGIALIGAWICLIVSIIRSKK